VVVVAALVVATVAMVVALVVAVAPMMAQSKGAHAKNPARSARKQATMPGTVGTAIMMMMMSTKTSLQGLLLWDMALTLTGMQTWCY
jgi:selenophosphate synthetase-related protein